MRRISSSTLLFVFCLVTFGVNIISAWSPEDREIFALREEVEKDLGKGSTFYEWLGVAQNAPDAEIVKAYRTLSRKIHPDKNPHSTATERFARLGLVANVLRSEARERYDFFLDHGFPRWKGTDYYYSRYRPGLVTVIIFLYCFISGAQYLLLKISASRNRSHMNGLIEEARHLAWSGSGSSGPGTKRRVALPNGKLFTVYPEGTVFLVHNEAEYLLDINEIQDPRWKDTLFFKLPRWIIYKTTGKRIGSELDGHVLGGESVEKVEGDDKSTKKKRPAPATKVAGSIRRRK